MHREDRELKIDELAENQAKIFVFYDVTLLEAKLCNNLNKLTAVVVLTLKVL